jgi:hypothetical protein
MTKGSVLQGLDREWQALLASFEALSPDAQLQSGVAGQWSARDVLAHITTWEEECLEALPVILESGKLPRYSAAYGGVDAFNALQWRRKRGLALDVVKEELRQTHERLVAFLEQVPEDAFVGESRFRRRLRLDTYRHYREHAAQISAWRRGRAD